jgi:Zn-finger nucleic acid-binding protein
MGLATREARKAASAALLSWAACVRKVFEVDPVLCEKCGGEMKLVAVVLDDGGLDRILAHQGWPTDFPKTRRYEDFRSGVCAGPEGSRPKPSRAPPRREDGSDAESQVDSGVERWDGKDEPSGEQPA